MVVYEWRDANYLGKITSMTDDSLPVSLTFICLILQDSYTICSRKRTSAQRMLLLVDFAVRKTWVALFLTYRMGWP
jgi:hypothetical protein